MESKAAIMGAYIALASANVGRSATRNELSSPVRLTVYRKCYTLLEWQKS
jgi:hypothetical protein